MTQYRTAAPWPFFVCVGHVEIYSLKNIKINTIYARSDNDYLLSSLCVSLLTCLAEFVPVFIFF